MNNRVVAAPVNVDAGTSQATLDGFVNVPGLIMHNVAGRSALPLPNLRDVSCDFKVTNNPDLVTLAVPVLQSVGCNVDISGNPVLEAVLLSIANGVGGHVQIRENASVKGVSLSVGDRVGSGITIDENSAANAIDVTVGEGAGDSIRLELNPHADSVDLSVGPGGVDGSVVIGKNNRAEHIFVSIAGDVTGHVGLSSNSRDADRPAEMVVDIAGDIGDAFAITDNPGSLEASVKVFGGNLHVLNNGGEIRLSVDGAIGGDVHISSDSDSEVEFISLLRAPGHRRQSGTNRPLLPIVVSSRRIAGDSLISTSASSLHASTADGRNEVSLKNAFARMTLKTIEGTFPNTVGFSIERLAQVPDGRGTDTSGHPVWINGFVGYQFAFDDPILNEDASLTFEVDVESLGLWSYAFLTALDRNLLTLAIRKDPATEYQSFPVCAGDQQKSGGCVLIDRLNATGGIIPAGDPTTPTTVRVAGIEHIFPTYALVVALPIDETPPVLSNVPANLTAVATAAGTATVTFTTPRQAVDDLDGAVPVSCTPVSGSSFAVGTTTVRCTAEDLAHNRSEASFSVIVSAAPPPNPPRPGRGGGALDPVTVLVLALGLARLLRRQFGTRRICAPSCASFSSIDS